MKKRLCLLLVGALICGLLSGCGSSDETLQLDASQTANFQPEITVAATSALAGALDGVDLSAADELPPEDDSMDRAVDQPITQDEPLPTEAPTPSPTPESYQPFITATPQPNAVINGYTEVSGPGLGFSFSYPVGWTNIPARRSVCYVQPLSEGVGYPARVVVTMKKVAHKCNDERCKEQLVNYIKTLMGQYDAKTFEVNTVLDVDTKFMGRSAMSTTYLAYDGTQEIMGYVIMTYFEKYLFCFHFLCAYEDYPAYESAIYSMRDSVKANQNDMAY